MDSEPAVWRKVNLLFVPLILDVAKDKGVYLQTTPRSGSDPSEHWVQFRKFPNAKQEQLERLKDTDPETYSLLQKTKTTRSEIETRLRQNIESAGLIYRKTFLPKLHQIVISGVDQVSGESVVYSLNGEVTPLNEFIQREMEKKKAFRRAQDVGSKTQLPLKNLRKIDSKELDRLVSRPEGIDLGPLKWVAITDGKAKVSSLTHIVPVREIPQRWVSDDGSIAETFFPKVIVSGRYKGIFLEDMVNSQGRMIEGTTFSFDPSTGRSKKIPLRQDEVSEPYITVAEYTVQRQFQGRPIKVPQKKLFIRIPNDSEFTPVRTSLKALSCNMYQPGEPGVKVPKEELKGKGVAKKNCIPGMFYMQTPGLALGSFTSTPKIFRPSRIV